jgi:hypothetical protein
MPAALDEARDAFWSRYNRSSEFPISAATAVLIHSLVAGLVVLTLGWFMQRTSKPAVAMQLVFDYGSEIDGASEPVTGAEASELPPAESLRASELILPLPAELPQPIEPKPEPNLAEAPQPVPTPKADFRPVDDALRGKLSGSKKGDGGEKGTGPGGTGADASRARMQRWVLRFRTADGEDYLNQLAAMKAELLVPLPPDEKTLIHIPDLKNPAKRGPAAAEDLKRLAGFVRFSDLREESVRGVCEALKLDAKAKSFHAFFPKQIEEQLAKKEIGFHNRRPEGILQTVFEIRIVNGDAAILVVDQVVKP